MAVNVDSPLPTPKNWCHTDMKVNKLEFEWTINNFSLQQKPTGEYLSSSTFSTDDNNEIKWFLRLYPNGENEQCIEYVSLYLWLKSKPSNRSEVRAYVMLCILNDKREKSAKKELTGPYDFATIEGGLGYRAFCKRDFIFDETNRLLSKDKLTIYCKISILEDSTNISGQLNIVPLKQLEGTLSEDFQNLFVNEKFSDITFTVGGRELRAHKSILAARSDVFAAMFEHEMEEKILNHVTISDIDYEVMKEMLNFIYTDKAPNIDKLAYDLLPAADKYDLENLKIMCTNMLYTNLSVETAIDTLILADHHNAGQLKVQTIDFISKRVNDIMKTQAWQKLITTYPHLISDLFRAVGKLLPQI